MKAIYFLLELIATPLWLCKINLSYSSVCNFPFLQSKINKSNCMWPYYYHESANYFLNGMVGLINKI